MKLTLSAKTEVIQEAKRIAKRNDTSVSAMFERLIRAMSGRKSPRQAIGPLTRKASGIISIPPDRTERQLIEEALLGKYGAKYGDRK